jgi:hypothetical protein
MTTSNGLAHQAPLYVRALRLRHLHVGGFVSFLLFECMIAAGVLLALAELVSWWAVPVLPAVVAIMVKVNDLVIGGSRRARASTRDAGRGSSERASSVRVDPDAHTGETTPVARRTTTTLDRAEIARAGGAGSGGTAKSTATGVRTRTVEPPAQRKKVGVIRISVPPRDAGTGAGSRHAAAEDPGAEARDHGYGISPAADETAPADEPAVADAAAPAEADGDEAVHAAPGDEWTDTDAHGYQRSRPLHPSGWSSRAPAQDPWAEQPAATEPARPAAPDVQSAWAGADGGQRDWPGESGVWGDRAAWSAAATSGSRPANWGDETAWGDRAAWEDQAAWGDRAAGEDQPAWGDQAARGDRAAWADQAAWGSDRAAWADPTGPEPRAARGERAGWGDQRATVAAPQGERAARGDQRATAATEQGPTPAAAADWDDETGWADQAAWGSARSGHGAPTWDPYAGWEGGAPDYAADYTGEDTGARSAFARASREQAARDLAARGEAYRASDTGGGQDGATGGHDRYDAAAGDGPEHANNGHAHNRESTGRHARQQPPGRRRSEDTDNVTSGHFAAGRHAERPWRSDEDLARQRTGGGGVNQGRFA